MASLNYDDIYSSLFTKIEAYDFIDLSEEELDEFLCNWLRSAATNPYVRKLFSTVVFDDEISELNYEMKYVVDEESDRDFVIEVLSLGMAINWLKPKIHSITNITQFFGSKDEKWYSQASHLSELRGLLDDFKKQQRRMIADRGYIWNSYLDGE